MNEDCEWEAIGLEARRSFYFLLSWIFSMMKLKMVLVYRKMGMPLGGVG